MADSTQQDGQKTIVAFVVGLLIGGMLVWAFSGPTPATSEVEPTETETTSETGSSSTEDGTGNGNGQNNSSDTEANAAVTTPTLPVGNGAVTVAAQPAGTVVNLGAATYPVGEGWIGVRDYSNDQLGTILGVVRFSESDGLVPERITLLRATTAGRTYAVVMFADDGDRVFQSATDVQIPEIFATFTAQ